MPRKFHGSCSRTWVAAAWREAVEERMRAICWRRERVRSSDWSREAAEGTKGRS
jgi:hypothetical protein